MASAIGRRGRYEDHGVRWNHAERNAHYGPFEWTGRGRRNGPTGRT